MDKKTLRELKKERAMYQSQMIRHLTLMEGGQSERIASLIVNFFKDYKEEFYKAAKSSPNKRVALYNLNKVFERTYKDLYKLFGKELLEIAKYENKFQKEMYKIFGKSYIGRNGSSIGDLSDELLLNLVQDKAFEGDLIEDFLNKQKIILSKEAKKQFNIGVASGLTTDQIADKIALAAASIGTRNAVVISRTAVTNVLNTTRYETYKEIGVKKYQYVAIIDSRTTDICKSLNGKIFLISDPNAPRPPQHYQCRSSIIALYDDEFDAINYDYAKWASSQDDINIKEKDGKFVLNPNEVTSLSKLKKEEKDILNKVKIVI